MVITKIPFLRTANCNNKLQHSLHWGLAVLPNYTAQCSAEPSKVSPEEEEVRQSENSVDDDFGGWGCCC